MLDSGACGLLFFKKKDKIPQPLAEGLPSWSPRPPLVHTVLLASRHEAAGRLVPGGCWSPQSRQLRVRRRGYCQGRGRALAACRLA